MVVSRSVDDSISAAGRPTLDKIACSVDWAGIAVYVGAVGWGGVKNTTDAGGTQRGTKEERGHAFGDERSMVQVFDLSILGTLSLSIKIIKKKKTKACPSRN